MKGLTKWLKGVLKPGVKFPVVHEEHYMSMNVSRGRKHKHDGAGSDDEWGQSQALPVAADDGGSSDEDDLAKAAREYLMSVREEAQEHGNVLCVEKAPQEQKQQRKPAAKSGLARAFNELSLSDHRTARCPDAFLPTELQQADCCREFRRLHAHIENSVDMSSLLSSEKQVWRQKIHELGNSQEKWRTFCFGSHSANLEAHMPTTELICSLSDAQVVRLLGYCVDWISTGVPTLARCEWVYAVLLRLSPDFVLPDVAAHIRSLIKRLLYWRAEHTMQTEQDKSSAVNKDRDELLAAVQALIVLAGKIFGQHNPVDDQPLYRPQTHP